MDRIGKSFSNLIYDNILFKHLLPSLRFPHIVFPAVYLYTPYLWPIVLIVSLLLALLLLRLVFQIRRSLRESSVILELTPPAFSQKSAYTTSQLFTVIHNLGTKRNFLDKILGRKISFSLEIVSTLNQGIRFLIRTSPNEADNIKRNLFSYLPQAGVKQVEDYLPKDTQSRDSSFYTNVVEYQLAKHFAFPLQKQNLLSEHDPVAYITGMMTKLSPGELVAFQIVLAPKKVGEVNKLSAMILHNENVLGYLNRFRPPIWLQPIILGLSLTIKLIKVIGDQLQWAVTELVHPSTISPAYIYQMQSQQQLRIAQIKPARVLSSFEEQTIETIQAKINQSLFESSIRLLTVMKDKTALAERSDGFTSSLAVFSVPSYQEFKVKRNFPSQLTTKVRLLMFRKRLLSLAFNSSSSLLSVSEAADLFHFPFAKVTQTENIVKVISKELPAPLSLKQGQNMSVVFGKNTYAGTTTPIGLTADERKTHMYILGRTGSGKTTLMFSMAKSDLEKGEGLAFIDPHGDVAEDLLVCVPEERKDDLIYFNPIDLKYPIGINLLELTPGLDEDEAELEKELVAEGVVSLFRKVFSKEENANAHRIEYILRNTIHTAFTTPNPTIFTVYNLLNNPPFQSKVVSKLEDENLKNFWKYEFGRAGDYQVVKMTGGVTAKIGRFLFSPTAKRILEQEKSTINFNDVLNGKILICNLPQGKLGEDTARLLGTTILTKLQQAALKRADLPAEKRKQFHLYVDEFQNFATLSFTKMLSEARKYGLALYIAEQSTSQQQDRTIVNVILANVTTVICFKSGNPLDEQLMLSQFSPYVQEGEIQNLPRYHFYIKISAVESEEPFSGETLFDPVKKDVQKMQELTEASRKNWAIKYVRKPKLEVGENSLEGSQKVGSERKKTTNKNGLPENN